MNVCVCGGEAALGRSASLSSLPKYPGLPLCPLSLLAEIGAAPPLLYADWLSGSAGGGDWISGVGFSPLSVRLK